MKLNDKSGVIDASAAGAAGVRWDLTLLAPSEEAMKERLEAAVATADSFGDRWPAASIAAIEPAAHAELLRELAEPRSRGGGAEVDKSPAALPTNSVGRGVSLRRVAGAIFRAFVEASSYETDESVVIAMGWCCPWLCFPITPRSPSEGGRRT